MDCVVFLLAVAIAGCGGQRAEPVASTAYEDLPPPIDAALDDAAAADGSVALAPLPERYEVLGTDCADLDTIDVVKTGFHGTRYGAHCGRGDKVAGVYRHDAIEGYASYGGKWIDQIPSVVLLERVDSDSAGRGHMRIVVLEGTRLWIEVMTCGRCRRVMGWSFVGDLELLTDGQLLRLQQEIGLPANLAAMRSPSAWLKHYGH